MGQRHSVMVPVVLYVAYYLLHCIVCIYISQVKGSAPSLERLAYRRVYWSELQFNE